MSTSKLGVSRCGSRISKGGWGGVSTIAVGVSGSMFPPKILKIKSSLQNDHFQHFKTKFHHFKTNPLLISLFEMKFSTDSNFDSPKRGGGGGGHGPLCPPQIRH